MKEKKVRLSERMQMIASMVTPGNSIVDVGCDHGFLPIRLVQDGTIPGALAMDVRSGPLQAAKEHIAACGLEQYIKVRLSDGLKEYCIGEAKTLVCAGMGGRLMEKILTESFDKVKVLEELILQPQSELAEFRAFLRKEGFRVVREDAVFEDGKYYFAMKVIPGELQNGNEGIKIGVVTTGDEILQEEQVLYDSFGKQLLLEKHPVLRQYLIYRKEIVSRLQQELPVAQSERTLERRKEISFELACLDKALRYFE